MTIQEASDYFIANERMLRNFARYHYNKRLASHPATVAWTADDIYQETITKALEKLHQFKGGDFTKWVGVIMTNLACSLIQRHVRGNIIQQIVGNQPVDSEEEVLEREAISERLYEEIESLPPNRGIAMLYLLDAGHRRGDGEAVAKDLGIPLNSLKQFKFQAYNTLRKKLNP